MQELEKILDIAEINAIKDLIEENKQCYKTCEGCCNEVTRGKCNCKDALIINVIEKMKMHMNDGWIPVEERLPEEKTNPVTQDFYEYQVTAKFQDIEDIRHYKFGNGHWWHGPGIVDQYVVAWLPRPDPYRKEG